MKELQDVYKTMWNEREALIAEVADLLRTAGVDGRAYGQQVRRIKELTDQMAALESTPGFKKPKV